VFVIVSTLPLPHCGNGETHRCAWGDHNATPAWHVTIRVRGNIHYEICICTLLDCA
jgi:hypothetical protein